MYSMILRERPGALSNLLDRHLFWRSMGGGPRAFPAVYNKWQWKRLHDMAAKEKQLYQVLLRSQIRCRISMSPEGHVKALSDRFVEAGAEDLWYDEGHTELLGSGGRNESTSSPNSMRKLMSRGHNLAGYYDHLSSASVASNYVKNRSFSAESGRQFWGNDSSLGEEKSSFDSNYESSVRTRNYVDQFRSRFRKTWSSSSDDDSSDDMVDDSTLRKVSLSRGKLFDEDAHDARQMSDIKKEGSSASWGKYDTKLTKRVSLNNLEMEVDYSGKKELVRHEVRKRNSNESEESVLSTKRFDVCGVSSLTVKALSDAGFFQMSRMQEATLAVALKGNDALVRAKTSTGKSLAFLLPAIEAVMNAMSCKTTQQVPLPPVYVLVLCPTRELVSLIAAEAKVLLKYHDGIGVQTLVGATSFKLEQERLESDPCQIIVATPGRLLDHIESKSGLSARLMGLEMLILDEVNLLLDLGFWKDIEKIVDCLPRRRQSLLFSATIPKQVRQISQVVLKKGHALIDTVGMGFVDSCVKVKQSFLVAPHDQHFQIVHYLLKEHILQVLDYKVIVFCSTAMITSFMHLFLREMKMNVREIHSQNTQLNQIRISDESREAKQLILVSSDVSAREMNDPDVTLVIQVGIPLGRVEYIQRLQRTGRRGRGEGILLLAPWEEYFLDKLKDHPLEGRPLPSIDPNILLKTKESMARIDTSVKEAAYHDWLWYYNSIEEIGRDKTALFELANRFCESIGLQNPPPPSTKTTPKMGLKDTSGICIQK